MGKNMRQILDALIQQQYENSTLNVLGHVIAVTQGVTQGSALAPNLFNIYLHHMLMEDEILAKKIENH